jgi:hypothetical protein
MIAAFMWVRWRSARLRGREILDDRSSLTLDSAVKALLIDMAGIVRPHKGKEPGREQVTEFRRRLSELGYSHVATIVDERLKRAIEAIDIPEQFFEPETIVSQPRRWSDGIVLLLFMLCMFSATIVIPGVINSDPMKIGVGMFVLIISGIPVARSFGFRIGESIAPAAALGTIEDNTGRRWTIDDSCLFVRSSRTDRGIIQVVLTGPAGLLAMRYWGVDDAGFRVLWQRWNHPHPRTELG